MKTLELQQGLLRSALDSLHTIQELALEQFNQDHERSRRCFERHQQSTKALKEERNQFLDKIEKLARDTQELRSDESLLQLQLGTQKNRLVSLESQISIQKYVLHQEKFPQWMFSMVLNFLDALTVLKCSRVCKKWNMELCRKNAFLASLKSYQISDSIPTAASKAERHFKFTLTIYQLDKFSYICDLDAKECSSCYSSAKTDSSRLIITICEREPGTYLRELVFARSALAFDRCIQDMNSNIAKKKSMLVDTNVLFERLLLEEKRIEAQLALLGKSVLDLKTQYASDSHTLMFLERELESMSTELKFGIERENGKRAEVYKLRDENRTRRLAQERQRNLLLTELNSSKS